MEKINADYVLEKLREINLPFPRKKIGEQHMKAILLELDDIEQSLLKYREFLKSAKKIKK